jgi:DNA-binding response OmpR family regulator
VSSRILVLEDDPDAALFAIHVLSTRGRFEVVHAPHSASALHMAATEPWNLVLTGMELPGLAGLELLQALRETAPGLPVVVLTGHPLDEPLAAALSDLASAVLTKPVPVARLLATVTALAG